MQRGPDDSVRPGISRDMACPAILLEMVRGGERGKSRAGMCVGNFTRIDEVITPRGFAEQDQQHGTGAGNDRQRCPSAPNPQCGHRRTFCNWPAATSVGQRTGFAFATGTRTNPATFRFARIGFENGLALRCRTAAAFRIRPASPAGITFAGMAANPVVIRPRVFLRIEIRGRKLFAHRAPPEKPNTSAMCSAVKISRP